MSGAKDLIGKLGDNIENIVRIDFEVWSNNEILDSSAIKDPNGLTVPETILNTGEPAFNGVLDGRLGTVDRRRLCETCGETTQRCPGHFGHIRLVEPAFHMGLISYLKNFLSCICISCKRILVDKNERELAALRKRPGKERYLKIRNATKNVTHCQHCGFSAHKITIDKKNGNVYILAEESAKNKKDDEGGRKHKREPRILTPMLCQNIMASIVDEDLITLGLDPTRTRPKDMVHKNFPVPSIPVRPSVKIDSQSSSNDDDLTHKLIDIIKSNENIKSAQGDGSLTKNTSTCDDFVLLQIHIATFFDNQQVGIPKSCQKSKKVTKSLSERLKGKEGRIRGNLMGKRVDYSGRTVIGPDPYINLNEIGVPLIIAKNLSFPEIVTKQNMAYLTELVKNGPTKYPGANVVKRVKINDKGDEELKSYDLKYREAIVNLEIGDVVERHLINGDILLFNRQPSLHKLSMMGHYVHVIPTRNDLLTFRMNPSSAKPYNADFDGDEMNVHIPQSIQTATELMLIMAVNKCFINPRDSKIAFVLENDTVMGSYLQTQEDVRIDWKDAMNIMMSTSIELDANIPKYSSVSGKYLYSQLLNKNINLSKGKGDKYDLRIVNGNIIDGIFAKDFNQKLIQTNLHQNGNTSTVALMDNIQRMCLKWLLLNGFTTSISDLVIPKKIQNELAKVVETKRKDILSKITKYENDPYVMSSEAHELMLATDLASIQASKIDTIAMDAVNQKGGVAVTILSGASGTAANLGQNIGCLGQLAVERRRIIKKYNNRALPMFHQYDNSAFARGFCPNSYLKGLFSWEYFFSVMAGREGVISTAIKTAETGYIQRRLVKMLEDIKCEYDGTVRNANDKIIQYVCGDSGFSTEKQIEVKLHLLNASNTDLKSTHIYSTDEMNQLKNKIDKRYTADTNTKLYKKLVSLRSKLRYIEKKTSLAIMNRTDDYPVPVDLEQYITNVMQDPAREKGDTVDPYFVLESIKDMYSGPDSRILKFNPKTSTIKKKDDLTIKLVLKAYLYDVLSPKKCTHKYKLTTDEFKDLVAHYKKKFQLAKIEGGVMIGCIAAHGIGEPVTQSNLKAFHKAGSSAAAALSGGLPRVKEIMGVSKNIKVPITTIILDDEFKTNKSVADRIASYIKHTTVGDVIDKVEIIYDPKPFDKNSLMNKDGATNILEIKTQGKGGCTSDIKNLPWVIKFTMSKENMLKGNINLTEFKISFCDNWNSRVEDSKGNNKEYKKIIEKITACGITSNFDNSPTPIVHIRFNANNYNINTLIQFQDMIVKKYRIKGIQNINGISEVVEKNYFTYDDDGKLIEKKQWIILAEGINMKELGQINGINLEETYCNDFVTIHDTYGVEAARSSLIREITLSIQSSGGRCNYQHIELLADTMTHLGGLIAVNRHGTNRLDTDPLSKASFEEQVEQLMTAAVFGESDHIRSLSSRIMVGNLINGGTGAFELLLDHQAVKKVMTEIKTKETKEYVAKKSSVVDKLVKNAKKGK